MDAYVQLDSLSFFVLDEADRMLDMGFRESLHKIMQALPDKRQTLLFSATVPQEVGLLRTGAFKKVLKYKLFIQSHLYFASGAQHY